VVTSVRFNFFQNMYYSLIDRIRCCNNCGEKGHIAAMCRLKSHCPICAERDGSASYRPGGANCLPHSPQRLDECNGYSARVPVVAPVPEVGVHGIAARRVTDAAVISVPHEGDSTSSSSRYTTRRERRRAWLHSSYGVRTKKRKTIGVDSRSRLGLAFRSYDHRLMMSAHQPPAVRRIAVAVAVTASQLNRKVCGVDLTGPA